MSRRSRHSYGGRRRKSQDAAAELTVLLVVLAAVIVAGSTNNGNGSGVLIALVSLGLLIGLGFLGFMLYMNFRKQQALRLLDLAAVDHMTGLEFERWVGAQLQARGYTVKFTPINDYGVDIVAKKDGVKAAVQVKCYRRALDQKPVREAVAGMMHYKCSRAMVITNSYFTNAAKALAGSNRCELIDRDKLAAWLAEQR